MLGENEMKNAINKYFAAANGFTGFRSYFNKIFDPLKFTKIFILKGGPGTGKSSLMKKIKKHFCDANYECDEIYCSSDPNSLDGIIIKKDKLKFGIIDGTAPHESDPTFPGAIDEIINLGIAWNEDVLKERRNEIVSIVQMKKQHYKNAYEYLSLAGNFSNLIHSKIKQIFKIDRSCIFDIFSDIPNKYHGRIEDLYLISSFGSSGYKSILPEKNAFSKFISVSGIFGSEYLFMNEITNALKQKNVDFTLFPSPYSDDLIDGILIHDSDTFITTLTEYEKKIDTSKFIDEKMIASIDDILVNYSKEFCTLIANAEDEFKKASKAHFLLEEIYTNAMNFEIIDSITKNTIMKIEKLFIN